MNSCFKAVLGSQQIWEENTEFVNSPPHTHTHTPTHTHTHTQIEVCFKEVAHVIVNTGRPDLQGRWQPGKSKKVVCCSFLLWKFWEAEFFFLEGAQCFLLKLATEWMKLWKVIYFIQSLWLNVNYIFKMPSEKQTNWFDQASEYYNLAKLIQN